MLLKSIGFRNYSTFKKADFDLLVDGERPIVLFTGNNGAGKTSTLDAFRLGLHGRRSFLNGITDPSYEAFIKGRFHNGNLREPCSITLSFQYHESNERHDVQLERRWQVKRTRLVETISVILDGIPLTGETAEELIVQILPPEILGFFFFDAEKIGDLADWENDDDYKLFSSVNDLLGLRLVDQLVQDLDRVIISDQKMSTTVDLAGLAANLEELESKRVQMLADLRSAKTDLRSQSRKLDRAKQKVASMGGIFADNRKADERTRDAAKAACDAILENLRQEAAAYLPLLVAPTSLKRLQIGIDEGEQLEALNAIDRAFGAAESELVRRLENTSFPGQPSDLILLFRDVIIPKPLAVSDETLDLTLSEASWMRNVLTSELPRLQRRVTDLLRSHEEHLKVFQLLEAKIATAPKGDPDVEQALSDLHDSQRTFFIAEAAVESLRTAVAQIDHDISDATERRRKARHDVFRNRRLEHREDLLAKLLAALPDYARSSKLSKEQRFGRLLHESLKRLWHKNNRVADVEVNFKKSSIKLLGDQGEISKSGLSAAEKQIFAIAFIFALAKLSGKHLPFVIDTPLGRLDRAHRNNLITDFLPNAAHQVILFSTDTEIVGALYDKAKPLIQHHYELSSYNEGATTPVQLEAAL